jgi:hypothetical protein
VAFVLSFLLWPWRGKMMSGDGFEIAKFAIFLVQLVIFMVLAVYDAKWKEMPTKLLIASCGVGAAWFGVEIARAAIANEFSLPVIDLYEVAMEHSDLHTQDKIHFTTEGYTKIAEKIVSYLDENSI